MNAQQFLTWMKSVRTPSENPGLASRDVLAQLDAVLDAFPYFQSGHLLYIKNLHNQGSFLYNNQLKTAAAYAVNRKVLYELITLKPAEKNSELRIPDSELKTENKAETTTDKISEPLKFPPKKFTNDPDEWEAGMLRQLQLLHHWKNQSSVGPPDSYREGSQQPEKVPPTTEKSVEENNIEKKPDAKEEINTLLYVLVEPGQSEDLPEENTEETLSEPVSEEGETTSWEITSSEEKPETPVVVPSDPVQQEIIVEAIHSTFELEVDDALPSVDELKSIRIETEEQSAVGHPDSYREGSQQSDSSVEETVVTSFENMSFGEWLKEVNKKVPAPLPKTVLSEDKLIEKFISEEPRLNVKKTGFYNPVNMAKKSVQESDEFITETLARIYAKQGNHTKAIRAYQKLSLKFPEKTAYFAALIEEIKRTPNK